MSAVTTVIANPLRPQAGMCGPGKRVKKRLQALGSTWRGCIELRAVGAASPVKCVKRERVVMGSAPLGLGTCEGLYVELCARWGLHVRAWGLRAPGAAGAGEGWGAVRGDALTGSCTLGEAQRRGCCALGSTWGNTQGLPARMASNACAPPDISQSP